MTWILILFLVAVAFAIIAGVAFHDEVVAIGALLTAISCGFVVAGALMLYDFYDGAIGSMGSLPKEPIYRIDGRVQTDRGTVLVLSNGKQEARTVWAGKSVLPENARYVRVDKDGILVPTEPRSSAEPPASQPNH